MGTRLFVLVCCLLVAFSCGGNKSPVSNPGPNPGNPPGDDPPNDDPPPVPEPVWALPNEYIGRNVIYEPENDVFYVTGFRGRFTSSEFFAAKFDPEKGRSWIKSTATPDVYNWVTKGIGILDKNLYAVRWEDAAGDGRAKVFTNRYNDSGTSPSPWPVMVGSQTAGMDLTAGGGWIFAATIRTIITLTSDGNEVWRSDFGFGGRQNIGALATDGLRLFMVGSTGDALFGGGYGGAIDLFVAEVDPATGALFGGFMYGDDTRQLGDNIEIVSDGLIVATRDGLTDDGGLQRGKIVKFSFGGEVQWVYSTNDEKQIYGLTTDPAGNTYILSNTLRKISSSGSVLWQSRIRAYEGGGVAYDTKRERLYVVNDAGASGQTDYKIFRVEAASGRLLN